MKAVNNIKFPCGYEVFTVFTSYTFIGTVKLDTKDLPLCPLHGKECNKGD